MPTLRNVPKTFTFEQQRIEINEIAQDLYDLDVQEENDVELNDFEVISLTASGSGSLNYQIVGSFPNEIGRFSFTPPDLSSFWIEDTAKIANWDEAHGWGDHGVEGYITGISNLGIGSLLDVDTTTNAPVLNSVLKWNNTKWVPSSDVGIVRSDLSVVKPNPTANASGDVTYNNTNGEFTYTPPDLSNLATKVSTDDNAPSTPYDGQMWWKSDEGKLKIWYQDVDSSQWVDALPAGIQLGDISVITDNVGTNLSLSYDNSTGVLTFTPGTSTSGGSSSIDLTSFSVIANAAASASGGLSYDDTSGEFQYTPPDLGSYSISTHGHNYSLNDLQDVVISGTPANNTYLGWDHINGEWSPQTISADTDTTYGQSITSSSGSVQWDLTPSVGTADSITISSGSGISFDQITANGFRINSTGGSSGPITYSIDVTNSGTGAYTFSGSDRTGTVSGNNITININDGDIVQFNVNTTGHPFLVKTVSGTGTGNQLPTYVNGVDFTGGGVDGNGIGGGASNGVVTLYTSSLSGTTLYYNCQYHASMAGSIVIGAASSSGGATALDGLTDVTINNPQLNEVLKYDGSEWTNQTDATGTSGSTTFLEQTDTPNAWDDGKYLKSTTNGLEWATVSTSGGGLTVSTDDTPPTSPSDGDLWWDSQSGKLHVYYEDVDTSQWVEASGVNPGVSTNIDTTNTLTSNFGQQSFPRFDWDKLTLYSNTIPGNQRYGVYRSANKTNRTGADLSTIFDGDNSTFVKITDHETNLFANNGSSQSTFMLVFDTPISDIIEIRLGMDGWGTPGLNGVGLGGAIWNGTTNAGKQSEAGSLLGRIDAPYAGLSGAAQEVIIHEGWSTTLRHLMFTPVDDPNTQNPATYGNWSSGTASDFITNLYYIKLKKSNGDLIELTYDRNEDPSALDEYVLDQWYINDGVTINGGNPPAPLSTAGAGRGVQRVGFPFELVGSQGMEVDSNGIWTFPSPGVWKLDLRVPFAGNQTTHEYGLYLKYTDNDGTNWHYIARAEGQLVANNIDQVLSILYTLNIKDATKQKIQICTVAIANFHHPVSGGSPIGDGASVSGGTQPVLTFEKVQRVNTTY